MRCEPPTPRMHRSTQLTRTCPEHHAQSEGKNGQINGSGAPRGAGDRRSKGQRPSSDRSKPTQTSPQRRAKTNLNMSCVYEAASWLVVFLTSGEVHASLCLRVWLMECRGRLYVLRAVWMGCPYQTGSPQGHPRVSRGGLAGNDSGTGSGWQQSKQN